MELQPMPWYHPLFWLAYVFAAGVTYHVALAVIDGFRFWRWRRAGAVPANQPRKLSWEQSDWL